MDLAIALVIFLTAILIFYKYSINTVAQPENEDLLGSAKLVSSYLLSAGYPEDWTTDNVSLIGVTDGSINLSASKVGQFSDITLTDYAQSKRLLATTHDFYISFADKNNMPTSIAGVAGIGADLTTQKPENVIRVVRFGMYNGSLIQVVVYVW